MRKLILPSICIISALALSAQTDDVVPADTLANIKNAHQVIVTESSKGLNVEVNGRENDPNYKYSYHTEYAPNSTITTHQENSEWDFSFPFAKSSKKSTNYRSQIVMGGWAVGFNNAVNAPADMNVTMGSSIELSWLHILALKYSPWNSGPTMSVGFGINWRNYCMMGTSRFITSDKGVSIGSYPEGAKINGSRVKIFSLAVPFMLCQKLGAGFHVTGGAIVNFNTYGSIKTTYTDINGTRCKDFSKDIHKSPVTIDLMAVLGFKFVGWYVKYSPSNVLNTSYAPKFNSFSTGIIFGF